MSCEHITEVVNDEEVRLVRKEDGCPNRDVAVFSGAWAKSEANIAAWLQNMFDAATTEAWEKRGPDAPPTRWKVTIDVRPG